VRCCVVERRRHDPTARRPLILFLHGVGESGTDNLKQINANIDNLLAEAKERGAFLLAPQNVGSFSNSIAHDHVLDLIDRAASQFNTDLRRLYITGISMGGGDVWYFMGLRMSILNQVDPALGGRHRSRIAYRRFPLRS
jgi:predicted peptidase